MFLQHLILYLRGFRPVGLRFRRWAGIGLVLGLLGLGVGVGGV